MNPLLPKASSALVDQDARPLPEWRRYFESLAAATSNATLAAEYTALAGRVAALEADGDSLATVVGYNGIGVTGALSGDVLRITLTGGLDNLSDVDLGTVTPVAGDALVYDGTDWVPLALTTVNVSEDTNLYYTDARADARIAAFQAAPTLDPLTDALDDAAAATAGIPVGGLYRTASALKIRVA